MRIPFRLFSAALLSLLSVALLAPGALAKSSTVKGVAKKINGKSDSLTVKSGKKTLKVKLSSSARIYGADRSDNGAVGLEDVKKGDKLAITGKRKGAAVLASRLTNDSTIVAGDEDGDGVPDDVEVTEVKATISEVNPDDRTAVIDVADSDDESLLDTSILISFPEGARLIVGDRNRDKKRNWDDVQVGDRVMALLAAPVDPEAGADAFLMVDLSSMKKSKKKGNPARTPMGGEVSEVDTEAMTVTFEPLDRDPVTVSVTDETEIEADDLNEDGRVDISDIEPGQRLRALVDASDRENLVAVKLHSEFNDEDYDYYDDEPTDDSEQPAEGEDPDQGEDRPGPPSGPEAELKGLVVAVTPQGVAPQGLVLLVREGPQAGQSVPVAVDSSTRFEGRDNNSDGRLTLADVRPGDRVKVEVRLTDQGPAAVKVENNGSPERR